VGKLNGGYIFSSETCAFHPVGAEYIADVEPGEMIVASAPGLQRYQLAEPNPKLDIFEFVYFSRPDSQLIGKSVYQVRKNFGRELAVESPVRRCRHTRPGNIDTCCDRLLTGPRHPF